jgi:hypothetical protein
MSRRILLRIGNISDKFVKIIKTDILCSINFFKENLAVYEIMRKDMVEPERPQMTV